MALDAEKLYNRVLQLESFIRLNRLEIPPKFESVEDMLDLNVSNFCWVRPGDIRFAPSGRLVVHPQGVIGGYKGEKFLVAKNFDGALTLFVDYGTGSFEISPQMCGEDIDKTWNRISKVIHTDYEKL